MNVIGNAHAGQHALIGLYKMAELTWNSVSLELTTAEAGVSKQLRWYTYFEKIWT